MNKENIDIKEDQTTSKRGRFEHWQVISLMLVMYDIIAVSGAYFVALWGRFDFIYSQIPRNYLHFYLSFISIYAVSCIFVFWYFKLYRSMWRFASYTELIKTFEASVLTSFGHIIFITVLFGRMPMSYYLWGSILQFVLLIAARFSYRALIYMRNLRDQSGNITGRVMLIGAGSSRCEFRKRGYQG